MVVSMKNRIDNIHYRRELLTAVKLDLDSILNLRKAHFYALSPACLLQNQQKFTDNRPTFVQPVLISD